MKIQGFSGRHRWLSNFWLSPVEYEGIVYPSVEHAYQAAKTTDVGWKYQLQLAPSPKNAKALGYKLPLRPDWEHIKVNVMYELIKDKFTRTPYLREWLKATGDAHIEETNTWGDTFWGVCDGVGENNLGRIIMQVRELLQNGKI